MRIPLLWVWRLALGGFAIVYLASETLQAWLPPLLPFLAAAAVEAPFFVAGPLHGRGRTPPASGRGPRPPCLEVFGGQSRTLAVHGDDAELVLRPGELTEPEI